jgi:hypothetical protein
MIHWRETDTGYVASVTRRGLAALWGLIGAVPAWFLWKMGGWLGPGVIEAVPFAPPILAVMGLTTYLGCLAKAATLWAHTSWVEVALKGGKARWGERGGTSMREFVAVERFESSQLVGPWAHHVVAALPEGRRVGVLPSWVAPPQRTRRVADRLNELLDSAAARGRETTA